MADERRQQRAAAAATLDLREPLLDAAPRIGGVLLTGHGGAERFLDAGVERGFALAQAVELETARAEVQAEQRGGEHRGDAPGAPALLQRRSHRQRALQEIDRIAAGRGGREHAQRTATAAAAPSRP